MTDELPVMKKRGSRQDVFDGKALMTSGGLTKDDLVISEKTGKISTAKEIQRGLALSQRMKKKKDLLSHVVEEEPQGLSVEVVEEEPYTELLIETLVAAGAPAGAPQKVRKSRAKSVTVLEGGAAPQKKSRKKKAHPTDKPCVQQVEGVAIEV